MYNPFFDSNIFARIEFMILFGLLMVLLYKNISLVNKFYMNRFSMKIKIAVLLITIFLSSLIYVFLHTLNVIWVINVAVNAVVLALIVYLTISIFFNNH